MNQGFQGFLKKWFNSRPGKVLFKQEKHLVSLALKNKFGYYLLQIGAISDDSLLLESRVSNKVIVDPHLNQSSQQEHEYVVQANFDFLPLGPESADVILMPHTFDSVQDPHYLLRQLDKALIPEGYMVITGFNPAGCKVLRVKYFAKKIGFEKAQFRRTKQIKEWLTVLGYDIEQVNYTPVMCFSNNEKYQRWGRLIEKIERALQAIGFEFGNIYCIVAKKKVDSPTLVGMKWQLPSWKVAKNGSMTPQGFKPSKRQEETVATKLPIKKAKNMS